MMVACNKTGVWELFVSLRFSMSSRVRLVRVKGRCGPQRRFDCLSWRRSLATGARIAPYHRKASGVFRHLQTNPSSDSSLIFSNGIHVDNLQISGQIAGFPWSMGGQWRSWLCIVTDLPVVNFTLDQAKLPSTQSPGQP